MKKESRSKLVSFLVGGLVFLVFIFPLYWMVVTALKTQVEIFSIPTPLWPKNLTLDAFAKQLSSSGDTLRGFKNSLIISCGATAIATVLAIPAAYGLARFRFGARRGLVLFFLITQMLPSTLVLTSLYIMFSKMHLLNTYWAPILADATLGIPFSIIILRTYFVSIPKELDEAAKIDGCSTFSIIVRIIFPLCKPSLFSVAIFAFMWNWDDFQNQLIYLTKVDLYTVALAMRTTIDATGADNWGAVMAMALCSVLPAIVMFFCLQKYFVDGVSTSGLKG